jgi:hypothetical protein
MKTMESLNNVMATIFVGLTAISIIAAARLKLTHVWVRLMHCLCYTFGVGFVMSFAAVKNQHIVGCILPYILVTHFIFDTPAIKSGG